MKRYAGVLLSVTSLPSKYGIGCFSKEAYAFVDWLKDAGQTFWQILPIHPTSYGDSPYQSFSTFAGNHYLIDLDTLVEEGLLTQQELDTLAKIPSLLLAAQNLYNELNTKIPDLEKLANKKTSLDAALKEDLAKVQRTLMKIMTGLVAVPPGSCKLEPAEITWLEEKIDVMEESFARRREFVLYGENELSARLDLARAVVRRAERQFCRMVKYYTNKNKN